MENYEFYTLVFSAMVAVSTIGYSFLTWKIVRETKLAREYQNKPGLAIYLKSLETDASFIFFIVENFGLGLARNLKFRILKDFQVYSNNEIR